MSQSLGWADNLILAMAPLGILTIIVAAIRVGGPSWLRAVIGRATESLAVAESELMSSTSDEVCEFWDGRQIVKVARKEPMREFVILVPDQRGQANADAQSNNSNIEDISVMKLNDEKNEYLKERRQYARPLVSPRLTLSFRAHHS